MFSNLQKSLLKCCIINYCVKCCTCTSFKIHDHKLTLQSPQSFRNHIQTLRRSEESYLCYVKYNCFPKSGEECYLGTVVLIKTQMT